MKFRHYIAVAAALALAAPALAQTAADPDAPGDPADDVEAFSDRDGGDIKAARSGGDWCKVTFGYDAELGRNRKQAEYEAQFGPKRLPAGCDKGT